MAEQAAQGQPSQVYLSKPGGQREGPFSVEQINRDLAAKKYLDTDYWAWYDGLTEWVPLHAVPGVCAPGRPQPARPVEPKKSAAPQPAQVNPAAKMNAQGNGDEQLFTRAPSPAKPAAASRTPTPAVAETEQIFTRATARNPEPAQAKAAGAAPVAGGRSPKADVSSGLPFAALEQIFIFTTGDGRGIMQSPVVAGMLQDAVGEELTTIRNRVSRDIIGHCDFGERLRRDGAIPEAAWKAMSTLKPDVVNLARDGTYSACVRTFTTGAKEVVALFLFYNRKKM